MDLECNCLVFCNTYVGWAFSAGSIARNRARGIDYSSKDSLISFGGASVDLVNVRDDLYRDKQGDLRIEVPYNPANDSWMKLISRLVPYFD